MPDNRLQHQSSRADAMELVHPDPRSDAMSAPVAAPPIRRVLMIAPTPFFGDRGCHVRIFEELQALAGLGIEGIVVTYPTGIDPPGTTVVRAPALPGIRAGTLGPSWNRPILDMMLFGTLVRAARRFRPDVVHAHLHEGILLGAGLRALTGLPLVADLQGSLAGEMIDHGFLPDGGVLARSTRAFERWLDRQPDAVLVSSIAGTLRVGEQGLRTDHVVSLPDGADLDVFRPMPPDMTLARELGIAGKRVVVFLGVLTQYQGVDALLDAVPAVLRRVPDAHFLVMGFPNVARYREQVRTRGLSGAVSLPGRIPYADAARWLTLGTVAVSAKTSLTEANGKLLNYMACALPVVATDTPVNRELLGDVGEYVPVGDAAALGTRLADLLEAPARRRAIGDALRKRAEEQFAWPALARRLAAVYAQVARVPQRDPSLALTGHALWLILSQLLVA